MTSGTQIGTSKAAVVITCFNYAGYVADALDSVASQSYRDFECVVVDDASTDGSAEIVQKWIAENKDSRFKFLRQGSNSGQLAGFASGLAATSGEFVAFLDADDLWFPEFLERHVDALTSCGSDVGVSCSDLLQVDGKGRIVAGTYVGTSIVGRPSLNGEMKLTSEDIPPIFASDPAELNHEHEKPKVRLVRASFRESPWNVTSGLVFRRAVLEVVIPSNPEAVRICADAYIFSFCHYIAGSISIDKALSAYRRHGKNGYAFLPLAGQNVITTSAVWDQQRGIYLGAMLTHLLARREAITALTGRERTRWFARKLMKICLENRIPFNSSQLAEVIGRRQALRYRIKATFLGVGR